jgi:hypothetical protein
MKKDQVIKNDATGETLTVLVSEQENGGACQLYEVRLPPHRPGPPLHLPNAEQVVQDHSNCGLDCGLRRQRPTPLPFEAARRKCYEVFGAISPNQ